MFRLASVFHLIVLIVLAGLTAVAQEVPDAPTPKPSPSTFPAGAPPAPKNTHPDNPTEPGNNPPDRPVQTVTPPQQQPGEPASSRNDLFTFSVNVTFVQIPVTVKDRAGRLVEGLTSHDFTVFEDGAPQKLSYFSSEPFPLSAAIVVDTHLPSGTLKKVNDN